MNELIAESRVSQVPPAGTVVEFIFRGTHDRTHGREMSQFVEEIVAKSRPSAIVFNLLDYLYEFGDDVSVLFTAAIDRNTRRLRPVYIAATGMTYQSLQSLFQAGHITEAFEIQFVDSVEEAMRRLRAVAQLP